MKSVNEQGKNNEVLIAVSGFALAIGAYFLKQYFIDKVQHKIKRLIKKV